MSRLVFGFRHLSVIKKETLLALRKGIPASIIKSHIDVIALLDDLCGRTVYTISSRLDFSRDNEEMADNKFAVDYDKRGQAACKKCKQKLGKQALRIVKLTSNYFSDDAGEMKQYFHPNCIFETFVKARTTTKIIDDIDVLQGFDLLEGGDKHEIRRLITDILEKKGSSSKKTPSKVSASKKVIVPMKLTSSLFKTESVDLNAASTNKRHVSAMASNPSHKDHSFRQFRKLCADIADESSYTGKTKQVSTFLKNGTCGGGFEGEVYLLLKLLLPGVVKRVYNLNNKQLVKIFSQIFAADHDAMLEDVNQGDVAETIKVFFEQSSGVTPTSKSTLNIQQVEAFLSELSCYTKEDDQQRALTTITRKCTSNDLKMIIRLIKHDLRINSGAKHILDALDENAYDAFQASRDLEDVVKRVLKLRQDSGSKVGLSKRLSVRASLMTPVLPMLAEACKSVEMAFKKCPNGMYAEIKYDGERVQVHKRGETFSYYSRSLKPVQPHKVSHFKEYIAKAFPDADDLILDSEVLLVDNKTGNPLPFGSLGVHKKTKFQDANVCLFIFDCLHYNGDNLMDKSIKSRRKYLDDVMKEIPNRIMFSEINHVTVLLFCHPQKKEELNDIMARAFNEGLEGLVLKDVNSTYEPGKRHWLKVKKDYLQEGSMADSADLIVLGAYYGTGSKGGMMSIFLMGCYNRKTDKFVTVTKCGNGFDDKTLDKLQDELQPNMQKLGKNGKIPSWLTIKKGNIVPDFIVKDPKRSPVWEISGAEFSQSDSHTANGISIRFPRVTKVRDDKDWQDATDVTRLEELVKISKERSDFGERLGASSSLSSIKKTAAKRQKASSSDDDDDNSTKLAANRKRKPLSDKAKKPSLKKRASSSSSASSPHEHVTSAKREKTDEKPLCMYGKGCYQTNPKHRQTYSHDFTNNSSNTSTTIEQVSKKLPDLFQGMAFYLSDCIIDRKKLGRYIVAYDGDLVKEFDKQSATHIVSIKPAAGDRDMEAEHVTESWIWNCIKHKKRLPVHKS